MQLRRQLCVDLFHLCNTFIAFCSIIGATVISIGFYTVLWGKATEEKEDDIGSQEESTTIENVPILQSYKTVNSDKKIDGSVQSVDRLIEDRCKLLAHDRN